ncbi:hypothetical protein EU537_04440 [Candidatus Thorarchaeota archaeon]|nr:MAG: hypothetical protein EU537_04440 [Candidatus Thorarchaeota archaeon]
MRAFTNKIVTAWIIIALVTPFVFFPSISAYQPGDEEEIFGHTFDEEYWTNDSISVETSGGNASFTTSYVNQDNFSAFLIAFNRIVTNDSTEIILPYQLFGMNYLTPEGKEVFIGSIFAFLLVHNETYGDNNLPDIGNENAWYVVPMSTGNPWEDVSPDVESIPVEKIEEGHYRFGMRYINMTARVVSTGGGFLLSLLLPFMTVLFSEIVVEYDIQIDQTTGEVHAETIYTIGQVKRARVGLQEKDPSEVITDNMEISAVHYLSTFESNYNLTQSSSGNSIQPPTSTDLLDDNLTITIGDNQERAFDIGLGRDYDLINETTDEVILENQDALNALLATQPGDFLLIAWQAPLSAFLFAHMAYGLSATVRDRYDNPGKLAANATNAFHSSQWWYSVTFPEWNGLRVQQDPVYTAYTNLGLGILPGPSEGNNFLLFIGIGLVAIIAVVWVLRRR